MRLEGAEQVVVVAAGVPKGAEVVRVARAVKEVAAEEARVAAAVDLAAAVVEPVMWNRRILQYLM